MASTKKTAGATMLTPIDLLMPRSYVIGSVLFMKTSRRAAPSEIYRHLNDALKDTIKEVPFMGGYVGPVEGATGQYHIRLSEADQKDSPLIFNDMTSGSSKPWVHSFKSLSKLKFPMELMEIDALSPLSQYQQSPEPPVLLAQANFIDGGLVLFSSVLHSACDGLGWFNFVSIWASKVKASWDPDAGHLSIPVTPAMLDRTPLMDGSANVQKLDVREFRLQMEELSRNDIPHMLKDGKPGSKTDMRLGMFSITQAKLARLRDAVSATDDSGEWTTVNDALAALIWTSINRARFLETLDNGNEESVGNFVVAIDGRLRLNPPLPMSYLGNSSLAFPITLPIFPQSMGKLAATIRNVMTGFDNKHLRDVIGYLNSVEDVTTERLMYARTLNPTLVISNVKDMPFASLDWGSGLGAIETCRPLRPYADTIPRVMPMLTHKNGDVEILVWIEDRAMERLRIDPEWSKWAEFVCN